MSGLEFVAFLISSISAVISGVGCLIQGVSE
jgi:hypothetical protein